MAGSIMNFKISKVIKIERNILNKKGIKSFVFGTMKLMITWMEFILN